MAWQVTLALAAILAISVANRLNGNDGALKASAAGRRAPKRRIRLPLRACPVRTSDIAAVKRVRPPNAHSRAAKAPLMRESHPPYNPSDCIAGSTIRALRWVKNYGLEKLDFDAF